MNSQHIVDSIVNRDYNEAEQSMFESLTQKLNDKIIESKYEVANQFREEMDGGSGYDAFFKKAMKKFNISSPADLKTDEKKKEFFNYIDKNFTAKNEGYGGMGMMRRRGEEEMMNMMRRKEEEEEMMDMMRRKEEEEYSEEEMMDMMRRKEEEEMMDMMRRKEEEEYSEEEMMNMMRRKEEEEYSEEESGLRRGNPYLPVSTPDDKPPFDPRPVGGRPGPKITREPLRPNFPGISDPVGGRDINDPKITQDPLRPNFPGIEGEMPMMGAEMMGMDKKKKMGKESGDLESAIKKALDVAGKQQAQAPQAQGGMPGMGGGGQNPMAAMAKMMGGGQMPPMGGGMKPPMGGGQMPPMGGGMKPRMGGMRMKRRNMGGGM
jgi:hypothetical protein